MPARAARAAKSGHAASSARRTPSGPNAAPRTSPAPVSDGIPMIATRASATPASAACHFFWTSSASGASYSRRCSASCSARPVLTVKIPPPAGRKKRVSSSMSSPCQIP